MSNKLVALLGLSCAAVVAQADPAVIYDMGGKFDKSFNEAAFRGAEVWKKESSKNYLDFEISNEAQREQALRRMADKSASPVVAVGFSMATRQG